MTLVVLLAALAVTAIVYRSAKRTAPWLAPLAGIALFFIGIMTFPYGQLKANKTEADSNTTRPVIATHIDPVTANPTQTERAAPATGTLPTPAQGVGSVPTSRLSPNLGDKSRQLSWIATSKDGIRARLKDSHSAEFKDVFFSTFENHPVVCGQVNSKNGFGGYTGYQRFIASGDLIDVLQEQMEPAEFVRAWNRMCANSTP